MNIADLSYLESVSQEQDTDIAGNGIIESSIYFTLDDGWTPPGKLLLSYNGVETKVPIGKEFEKKLGPKTSLTSSIIKGKEGKFQKINFRSVEDDNANLMLGFSFISI